MNRQKQHRGAAAALAVLVLAAVLLFVGGSWLEKRSRKPETRTELPQETAETMEVDGVTYRTTRIPPSTGVYTGTRKLCLAQCSACRPIRSRLPP